MPATTEAKPPPLWLPDTPAPLAIALAANDNTAATTSFDNTRATRVSASRLHQCATDGHTSAANANGRKSTATETAAARTTSSSHSASAAAATRSAPMRTTKPGTMPAVVTPTGVSDTKSPENRFVVSTPALDRTVADMASVMAKAMRTSVTATPVSNKDSGRCTRNVRRSIEALWR